MPVNPGAIISERLSHLSLLDSILVPLVSNEDRIWRFLAILLGQGGGISLIIEMWQPTTLALQRKTRKHRDRGGPDLWLVVEVDRRVSADLG
jgi:hypothetical protein